MKEKTEQSIKFNAMVDKVLKLEEKKRGAFLFFLADEEENISGAISNYFKTKENIEAGPGIFFKILNAIFRNLDHHGFLSGVTALMAECERRNLVEGVSNSFKVLMSEIENEQSIGKTIH